MMMVGRASTRPWPATATSPRLRRAYRHPAVRLRRAAGLGGADLLIFHGLRETVQAASAFLMVFSALTASLFRLGRIARGRGPRASSWRPQWCMPQRLRASWRSDCKRRGRSGTRSPPSSSSRASATWRPASDRHGGPARLSGSLLRGSPPASRVERKRREPQFAANLNRRPSRRTELPGGAHHTSRLATFSAFVSMNSRRVSTVSPISVENTSSASSAWLTFTCSSARVGIERRCPELIGIHLAQAFVALNGDPLAP